MGHTVPIIWAVLVVFAALTVLLVYLGLFQDRSRGRPRCPKCWYNMTGAPSLVCPECGHNARSPKRLHRTRRRRWAIVLAALTAFCCYYSWLVRVRVVELHEPVTSALRPTAWVLLALPQTPPQADLVCLQARFGRYGVWPWESRLLLLHIDTLLSSNPRWRDLILNLLQISARDSRPAVDKLVELCGHKDLNVRNNALGMTTWIVGRLSDAQLSSVLDTTVRTTESYLAGVAERFLVEMIRRRRPAFRAQVAKWVADPPVDRQKIPHNLELLTALRRMDGQPDPMRVFVDGPQVVECDATTLPTIRAAVRNVDVDMVGVGITYDLPHSPRDDAWGFEVRDHENRRVQTKPPEPPKVFLYSGPGPHRVTVESGRDHGKALDMNKYMQPLPPGSYRIIVYFSSTGYIGRDEDVSRRLAFSSDPFELIVKPAGAESRPATGAE